MYFYSKTSRLKLLLSLNSKIATIKIKLLMYYSNPVKLKDLTEQQRNNQNWTGLLFGLSKCTDVFRNDYCRYFAAFFWLFFVVVLLKRLELKSYLWNNWRYTTYWSFLLLRLSRTVFQTNCFKSVKIFDLFVKRKRIS